VKTRVISVHFLSGSLLVHASLVLLKKGSGSIKSNKGVRFVEQRGQVHLVLSLGGFRRSAARPDADRPLCQCLDLLLENMGQSALS